MDTITAPPVASPWRTVWLSPRQTIRDVLAAEAPSSWWPVVALACVTNALGALVFEPDGSLSLNASFMPVMIGAAQTVFGVLIGPVVLAFVGSFLGGNADPIEIRPAVVWGYVPMAVAGLLWIPIVAGTRDIVPDPDAEMALWMLPFSLGFVVAALWSLVSQVIMVAEVQSFSVLRALLSVVIVSIPALLVALR